MSLYLDASAIVPLFIDEPNSDAVTDYLKASDHFPVVREFAAAEMASAVSRLTRTRGLTRDAAGAHLADLDAWRETSAIEHVAEPSEMRLAAFFVRRFELALRAPDALHLAACRRAGHTLVTLDGRLVRAATALGIAVENPAVA